METYGDSPHGSVLPTMGISTPNESTLSPEGDNQTFQKPLNDKEEAEGENDHFDKLEKHWAELRQNHLRWLEEANEAERLLQYDLDEAQAKSNQEFLKAHKARRDAFNKVQAMEMQQFEESHARRDLEFKKTLEARQLRHLREHDSESLAFAQQDVESEYHQLERQAEDAHEESQSQHKHDYKMARREREDQYYQSEAKHRANHRDEVKQLQDKAGVDRGVLWRTHPSRRRMEDIRAQIEQSHAALMLKLFGSTNVQDPLNLPAKSNSDPRTPPPDLSISPIDQASTMTTDPEQSRNQSQLDTLAPPISHNLSLSEEPSHDDGALKRPPRSMRETRTKTTSRLSALRSNADLSRNQHSPRSTREFRAKHPSRPSALIPNPDLSRQKQPHVSLENEAQIRAVEKVFKELGEDCLRKDLWQGVSNEMERDGFLREPESAANRWSSLLRRVCRDRGYDWAERVMSKRAFFKRRITDTADTGDEVNSATPSRSLHPKKRLKQSLKNSNTIDIPNGGSKPKQAGQMKSFYGSCISDAFSFDVTELDWSPDGKAISCR